MERRKVGTKERSPKGLAIVRVLSHGVVTSQNKPKAVDKLPS